MNKSHSNNSNNCQDYLLNNSFINDIQKYLTNGGDINDFNDNGDTLLIVAIKNNDLQAVKFLLDNNALTSLINNKMKSALDYAKEIGNPQIIELLQQEHTKTLEFWNANYSGIDFDTLEPISNMLEDDNLAEDNNNTYDNLIDMDSDNFNNQNDPYNNLFDDIPDLASDELPGFFNNLQNIDSQINNQNVAPLDAQDNTNQLNIILVNQEQNNNLITKEHSDSNWQCDICNKFFAYKNNLTKHKKYAHLSTKALKCNYDQCKKTFKNKYLLDQHYKYTHSNKDFKCPICDYKTSIKYDLEKHVNGIHTKKVEYACNHEGCNFKTFWPQHIKRHINAKHTKEIEYTCNHEGCGFKTFWPQRIAQHKKIKGH